MGRDENFCRQKIKEVEEQIKALLRDNEEFGKKTALLETIPGVSQKTAVAILSELPDVKTFESAREAASFAGLTPSIRQSGTSVNGRGSLSKAGNAQLRKALFMQPLLLKNITPL